MIDASAEDDEADAKSLFAPLANHGITVATDILSKSGLSMNMERCKNRLSKGIMI
jgi:hypothetical protein